MMIEYFRSAVSQYFNRSHLVVIIASLVDSLHTVDELVRGEELAPPLILVTTISVVYVFLPLVVRALTVIAAGGIIFVAQIFGHFIPILDRGPIGSDYTGVFASIGGAILVGHGVWLLRQRLAAMRNTP